MRASSPASGAYLDDLRFERLAHAVVLRSPHAHAWITLDRRRRRPARARRAGRPDGGRGDGRWAEAAAPLCRGQHPDRRAVRLRAPAAARATARCGLPASRWRWSWPRPTPRRSTPPSWSRSTTSRCPPSRRATRRARPARRCIADEVPGNVCLDWHTGDATGADAAFAQAAHVVTLQARQPSHRHQPDGAARRRRAVRSGERPLHAARLQPEHPHQPQSRRPRAGRRPQGRALHRARCRRRLRRQELRLCRARAGPVGGQAHRPAGEMDRQPQRGVPGRPRRARHAGRGLAGARCRGQVPGARRSRASPISAPTWRAPAAACRPTSTSICRARCTASPRSRCMSWRC